MKRTLFINFALFCFLIGGVIFYSAIYLVDSKNKVIAQTTDQFKTHVVNSAGAKVWESCEKDIGGGWVTRKNTRPLNADPNTPEGKVFYEYCYFPVTGQWLLMTRWDVHH